MNHSDSPAQQKNVQKLTLALSGGALSAWGALTNFSCKLSLFLSLPMQVHPLHLLATTPVSVTNSCQQKMQNYSITQESCRWILTKFCASVQHGEKSKWLDWSDDPVSYADPGNF